MSAQLVEVRSIRMDGEDNKSQVPIETVPGILEGIVKDLKWQRVRKVSLIPQTPNPSGKKPFEMTLGPSPEDSPVIFRGLESIPSRLQGGQIVEMRRRQPSPVASSTLQAVPTPPGDLSRGGVSFFKYKNLVEVALVSVYYNGSVGPQFNGQNYGLQNRRSRFESQWTRKKGAGRILASPPVGK